MNREMDNMWSRLVFSLRNPFLSKGLLQVLAQVRDRQVWGKLISYDNGRESSIREHLNMNGLQNEDLGELSRGS